MKRIPIIELKEGMIPDETICSENGTILISSGIPLTSNYIEKLFKSNLHIKKVAIRDEEIIEQKADSVAEVLAAQKQKVMESSQTMLFHSSLPEVFNLEDTVYKIDQMIQSILDKETIQQNLKYIIKNETLYNHSLYVTILAIHMGIAKGYNYMNLEFLGTCALLHDVGQAQRHDMLKDLNIKCIKNSPTNEHALAGFWSLRENRDLNILYALVALQHHEHFDGQGSPLGLKKNQITEFARLIAVADVYDNLIHVLNNTRTQAIAKILARSKTQFDPDMVTVFEKAVCTIK